MSEKYNRLKLLLLELFQLDKPDLDFGIYRIMHARSAEVTKFLDEDLLPQVKDALAGYESSNRDQIQADLDAMTASLEAAGVDPASSPKVAELKADLKAAGDVDAVEGEVYDLITRFFQRYYSEGDFISQRRYSGENTYAIPYNGEEVVLHWANKDQYYIKTSEYLDSYSFVLNPDDNDNPMRVTFRLIDAEEGEHGNAKAAVDKARVFVLAPGGTSGHDFAHIIEGELLIDFAFRPTTMADWPVGLTGKKPPAQKDITPASAEAIMNLPGEEWSAWHDLLQTRHVRIDGSESTRSKLEVHLDRYAKKNTFDYFIHKDLGGFLRRELDFFIKNEVMHLDDIENAEAAKVETYLGKIRAVRRVAGKVIDFLAQLEDFQRKLWLKKKFVVQTSYLVSVGSIDAAFYDAICSNDAQREEWVDLFKIDQQAGDLLTVAYTEPLTPEFLVANPTMTVNTELFPSDFTAELLESLSDAGLDQLVHGTLISSENFQALGLMQSRYRKGVSAVYIDPPYNTAASEIAYKNEYKHSSWLALMEDRLALTRPLASSSAILAVAIDDAEGSRLEIALEQMLGPESHLATVAVRSKPQGRAMASGFSQNHEYTFFYSLGNSAEIGRLPRTEDKLARYSEVDTQGIYTWANFRKTGADSLRAKRAQQHFPLWVTSDGVVIVPPMSWSDQRQSYHLEADLPGDMIEVIPVDDDGVERAWTMGLDRTRREASTELVGRVIDGAMQIQRKYRPNQEGALPSTWWADARYSASESGTKRLQAQLGGTLAFSYPKSVNTVEDCLRSCNFTDGTVLDFFGGSGTTADAVIKLNRWDAGHRKFVLVDFGHYFDDTLVRRTRRLIYCSDWDSGMPVGIDRDAPAPPIVKVVRLESYEDALNNLALKRSKDQQTLLDSADCGLREQYLLRYQLDVETEGSASLLTVSAFDDPVNYTMMIKRPGSDESEPTNIDLIETFNYLIGLTVDGVTAPRTFECETSRDARGRLQVVSGSFKQSPDGAHWFRAIAGTSPDGDKVLIIWRNRPGGDDVDPNSHSSIEVDNTLLNHWFGDKQKYSVRDSEFDLIYVNGDNNLENMRRPDEQWKVRRIDDEFHRLMFDTSGMP